MDDYRWWMGIFPDVVWVENIKAVFATKKQAPIGQLVICIPPKEVALQAVSEIKILGVFGLLQFLGKQQKCL